MAWCPKCKNEYIDGITRCSDCNVDLVDELVETEDMVFIPIGIPEIIDDAIDYLHKASIDSAIRDYDEDNEIDVISVSKKQHSDAVLHLNVYIQNEISVEDLAIDSESTDENFTDTVEASDSPDEVADEDVIDEDVDDNEDEKSLASIFSDNGKAYVKLSDKYEDVKSSAFTLLFVGAIGLIGIILEAAGIYTIPFSASTKWLFYTVMGGIFVSFIISGIVSFMHTIQLKADADAEDNLIEEILTWFNENYTKEAVDKEIDTDIQEELLFFNRAEFIKDKIMHKFEEADEALVDSLIEKIYTEMFE